MTPAALLTDAFDRILETALATLDGLEVDALATQPADAANSVGWLVWHLARVQDDHVAGVADHEQIWTSQHFDDRFALPFDADDTGYGHTAAHVAQVRASADLLGDYLSAVHARTVSYVGGLDDGALDEIVDPEWDPPVTRGVRLVSVISDDLQHAGQAAYVRGLLCA